MFAPAETSLTVDRAKYQIALAELRNDLLEAQFALQQGAARAVVVLIDGFDAAGKGEVANLLNEWMDPRLIRTQAFDKPVGNARHQPWLLPFWRALPACGEIGILFSAWYAQPLHDTVRDRPTQAAIADIVQLEAMLNHENVVLLKCWLHLSKSAQKARLQLLEDDPLTRWRVTRRDWHHAKRYKAYSHAAEAVLRHTDSRETPWLIIDAHDTRARNLAVGRYLLDALRRCNSPGEQAFGPQALAPCTDPLPRLTRAHAGHYPIKRRLQGGAGPLARPAESA